MISSAGYARLFDVQDGAGLTLSQLAIEDFSAWEAGAKGVWAALGPKVGGLDKIEAIAKTS